MAIDNNLFIEKHAGGYAILRRGVTTPLAVKPTQKMAIRAARKLKPGAALHVERVRTVKTGKPDKWRKV